MDRERVAKVIRELVKAIYNDCYGAYGVGDEGYTGKYEREIQNLTDVLEELSDDCAYSLIIEKRIR